MLAVIIALPPRPIIIVSLRIRINVPFIIGPPLRRIIECARASMIEPSPLPIPIIVLLASPIASMLLPRASEPAVAALETSVTVSNAAA